MMPADNVRSNLKLQDEYLANKQEIDSMFRSGDIRTIHRMFVIDERDLRPSVEQTPYMVR